MEIINTIQSDASYDFISKYENSKEAFLNQFKSALKQKPEDSKSILRKKMARKSEVVGISRAGCCGILESKKSKTEKASIKATLLGNNLKVPGQIEISEKGIGFI